MSVGVGNRLDTRIQKVEGTLGWVGNGYNVGSALSRRKGVRGFGSALLRRELARDGARGFGFGIGCSGVVLMTSGWA